MAAAGSLMVAPVRADTLITLHIPAALALEAASDDACVKAGLDKFRDRLK
jgi:hypothetical protein